jgi:hypothetical protein
MDLQKVTSREYKMLLRARCFRGDEESLRRQARRFWRAFTSAASGTVIRAHGAPDEIKARRFVTFLDTTANHLNAAGYIFRERRNADDDGAEVTLKFRHPDRFISQDRSMKPAARRHKAETKFEEDNKAADVEKAPFVSLYSFSTTVKGLDRRAFPVLKDVERLFPDLRGKLGTNGSPIGLRRVKKFTALELVLKSGYLTFARRPEIKAQCALIVWYDSASKKRRRPVVVEFSFRYGSDDGRYSGAACERAFSAFRVLETRLGKWVDPEGSTKTAFVYS